MTVVRPDGVATRVRVDGGAVNLVLDDQRLRAVGGKAELHSASAPTGEQLDIRVHGGARSLSVVTG
jgi:hypothetical protein